jgi:hypothetical protein
MGACTRRIAVVSIDIQVSSLHADRANAAAWCMLSPHTSLTRTKPLRATRGRPAVPEHGGGRDRLGDEAGKPDHEKPLSKVPHTASFRRMCQST